MKQQCQEFVKEFNSQPLIRVLIRSNHFSQSIISSVMNQIFDVVKVHHLLYFVLSLSVEI